MRASCCLDRDLALAVRADLSCGCCRLFFGLLAERCSLVHSLDDAEKNKGHDQEADDRVNEIADSQRSFSYQRDRPGAEIHAYEAAEQRIDDICYE